MKWLLVIALVLIGFAMFCKKPEAPLAPGAATDRSRVVAQDKLPLIKDTARKFNVEILSFEPSGNGATMRIQWYGPSTGPGGDFMNSLITQGIIRNLNLPAANEQGYFVDKEQRQVHWIQYQIIW